MSSEPGEKRQVLVVDDEEGVRHMLGVLLGREGYGVTTASSVKQALAELERRPYDVVLSDIRMAGGSGLDLLDEIRRRALPTTVIMMSAYGSVDIALEAMKRGAYDYVAKPFKPDEVVLVLRKAEERERLFRENQVLRQRLQQQTEARAPALIHGDGRMAELLKTVRKIADYKTTVLLGGESGTGKELVARAVHNFSPRASEPFVAVNCGAIPETLLESELFGHVRGAFTDAVRDKRGLFEEAHGGSLFLDEIGELPLGLQVKLLRALQEGEIRAVGGSADRRVDVRVIAATNRDLQAEVKAGRFREDLYYRLAVVQLVLPPLRDRREDIAPLIEHFITKCNARLGTRVEGVTTDAMKRLLEHPWPGNVRELENTIERAMVLSEGSRIEADCLPDRVREGAGPAQKALNTGELSIKKTVRAIEAELIRRALRETNGNRTNAAKILEISHRALLYKIKEFGLGDGKF